MLATNHNHDIPELTVQIAQAAFPKGNVVMKIRDELGHIYEDKQFESLYPDKGQPAVEDPPKKWRPLKVRMSLIQVH